MQLRQEALIVAGSSPPPVSSAVTSLVTTADAAADCDLQPGKFRLVTRITLSITGLSIGAAVLGLVPALSISAAVLCGIGALVSLSADLDVPSPRNRKTPKAALKCFAKSLKVGHWQKAYACLHPETLPESATVPRLLSLEVMPSEGSLKSVKGFTRFWKSILRGKGSTVRLCRKVWVSEPKVQGNYATAQMLIYVERFSAWTYLGLFLGIFPAAIIYMVNRKRVPIESDVTLFRHNSQWWLLPEPPREAK